MFVLFDIGATTTRIGVSQFGEKIDDIQSYQTPLHYVDAMSLFQKSVQKITKGAEIKKVAGGIAGLLNREKTKCIKTPHLPEWEKEEIKKDIERLVGAPVFLENDADLAALGEATYGTGAEYSIVGYMSISTGVGGGLSMFKNIAPHAGSFEPGFQIIDIQSLKTLEDYVSGAALQARYQVAPEEIDDVATWTDLAHILAVGISNTIRHWAPDVLILGGSIMNKIPIEEVVKTTEQLVHIPEQMPDIVRSSIEENVLYGALYLTHNDDQTV